MKNKKPTFCTTYLSQMLPLMLEISCLSSIARPLLHHKTAATWITRLLLRTGTSQECCYIHHKAAATYITRLLLHHKLLKRLLKRQGRNLRQYKKHEILETYIFVQRTFLKCSDWCWNLSAGLPSQGRCFITRPLFHHQITALSQGCWKDFWKGKEEIR